MGQSREKDFVNTSFQTALAEVRGGSAAGASAFYIGPTPDELRQIYERGFQGINPRNVPFEQRTQWKATMATMPRLYDVFPWAKGAGKGKVSATYLAILHFDKEWGGDEAQLRGDCTVHSTMNAAESDHAADALFGETRWMGRLVKEVDYRSRGYNGDGWSCQAPALWVGPTGPGGLLYRKVYEGPNGEKLDFTRYNSTTANWSGNGRAGVPSWLQAEAAKTKVKWIIPILSMEEWRDAIAIGFAPSVCSGLGFSSSTDSNGVAKQNTSWSHAMSHHLCVDTPWAERVYGGMIGGIQQQWGAWNSQNGKPEGVSVLPTGMFCARGNDIARMVKSGDSFSLCGVWGWDRSGWEAFDVTSMLDHLRTSTVQDYYELRAKRASENVAKTLDEMFLAV